MMSRFKPLITTALSQLRRGYDRSVVSYDLDDSSVATIAGGCSYDSSVAGEIRTVLSELVGPLLLPELAELRRLTSDLSPSKASEFQDDTSVALKSGKHREDSTVRTKGDI